jgi:ribosome biogenesis protein Nip4
MRPLEHFLIQFGIRKLEKGDNELFVQDSKYFLISRKIQAIIKKTKKPFHAGTYLGKSRGKKFFPSINLLNMINPKTSHKIWVDSKSEWLFVCGRDLFGSGISKSSPKVQKNTITLILNSSNEVIGFGKAAKSLKEKGVVVQNILDIGDFLRRERKKK